MARAGKRDRRVTLQRARLVEGDLVDTQVWDDLAKVWAEYEPLSDGERVRALQVGATTTGRFRILQCEKVADLSPQDQVVLHGRRGEPTRTFGIEAVKAVGAELEITASASVDRPL